jgi:hypothetical protein
VLCPDQGNVRLELVALGNRLVAQHFGLGALPEKFNPGWLPLFQFS